MNKILFNAHESNDFTWIAFEFSSNKEEMKMFSLPLSILKRNYYNGNKQTKKPTNKKINKYLLNIFAKYLK